MARAVRTLIVPSAILMAWMVIGFVRPALWPSEGQADDSLRLIWGRRAYLMSLWLIGAIVAHRWMCVVLLDGLAARALGKPIPKIFKDVLAIMALIGAVAGILVSVFGQSMAGFWAASGVLGIVLGIALRPIILDFFSGLGANLERAYNIGDWIVVTGSGEPIRGWIEEINWRTLRIRTRDGFIVMVPNSRLATCAVVNHSLPAPESRFQVRLRLDAEVAVDRALRILSSAASAATANPEGPRRLPAPDVLVAEASGEGIEYMVRFWLDPSRTSPDTVTHVVWTCVIEHLTKAGLTFAHPQENVFLGRLPRIARGFNQVEDRLAFLRRVALFQNFPDASLRVLASEVRMRSVRPAHVLVRAGDLGDSMFLVAEGTLRVLGITGEGRESVELATLQPGDVVGERSLLTGEPRNASVLAVTECIVLEVTREALQHLLDREPDLLGLLELTVTERELANQVRTDAAHAVTLDAGSLGRGQAFVNRMRQIFLGRR